MEAGVPLLVGGAAAGLFGSLLGLGGGILIVPLLTIGVLGFSLPIREAVGVSLVSVIVTSGASAGVYLQRHVANLRLGMLLELFTATGALVGGTIAFLVPDRLLSGLFTFLLVYTGLSMLRTRTDTEAPVDLPDADGPATDAASAPPSAGDGTAADGRTAEAARPTLAARVSGPGYLVRDIPRGVVGASFAGVVSALLGIGGGLIKVPVMHLLMGVPIRVATSTSNLMIGITASASAVIYLLRGGIDPYVAGPTAVGVFVGATIGSRTVHRVDVRLLRWLFVAVLLYTAFEMGRRALGV
ncbi:MAG TPA: sulfite exporter TauE/SafE family protein [Candidatus Limnocylindrales bacterium]|nr:sulfite exporter TauE/SafE family protein [Candidatus Limnocylindrales bacterium]